MHYTGNEYYGDKDGKHKTFEDHCNLCNLCYGTI